MINDRMADELIPQFEIAVAIQQMLIEKGLSVKEVSTWYHTGDEAVSVRVYQVKEE